MEKQVRIALWEPSGELLRNAEKLDLQRFRVVKSYTDTEEKVTAALELFDGEKKDEFDIMLIETAGFRNIRDKLISVYGLAKEQVYTFNEFWVLGCEEDISKKYHDYWKKQDAAGIHLFEGQVVLIAGGGSGIGYETAYGFLLAGAKVIIAGRKEEKLKKACQRLDSENVKYLVWDISETGIASKKIQEAEALFGMYISVLVNSAAVVHMQEYFDVTEDTFDDIFDVNIKGAYFMCQAFVKYLLSHRIKGHIVNVVSSACLVPAIKPYGVSKWGLAGLTEGLGQYFSEYGITVNGVAPGEVATDMAGWREGNCPARRNPPYGRVEFPCEIAEIILMLAGFRGEMMQGVVVDCSEGRAVDWTT